MKSRFAKMKITIVMISICMCLSFLGVIPVFACEASASGDAKVMSNKEQCISQGLIDDTGSIINGKYQVWLDRTLVGEKIGNDGIVCDISKDLTEAFGKVVIEVDDSRITTDFNINEFAYKGAKVHVKEIEVEMFDIEKKELKNEHVKLNIVSKDGEFSASTFSFEFDNKKEKPVSYYVFFESDDKKLCEQEFKGIKYSLDIEYKYESLGRYVDDDIRRDDTGEFLYSDICKFMTNIQFFDDDMYEDASNKFGKIDIDERVDETDNSVSNKTEKANSRKTNTSETDNSPKTADVASIGFVVATLMGGMSLIVLAIICMIKRKKTNI